MRTTLDAVDILYSYIKNSLLMTGLNKVNGGLYKLKKPLNSSKEDIIINSLPLNNEEIQEGILNVNIYVPNLELPFDGLVDKTQPNTVRLKVLSSIAAVLFEEFWSESGDYTFNLQQQNTFSDDNNQHYTNLRIEFYSLKN